MMAKIIWAGAAKMTNSPDLTNLERLLAEARDGLEALVVFAAMHDAEFAIKYEPAPKAALEEIPSLISRIRPLQGALEENRAFVAEQSQGRLVTKCLTFPLKRSSMASAAPPTDNNGQAEKPQPLTFKEHEQAVSRANAALALVLRRAEEAGHGVVFQMMSSERSRSWAIGIERDTHPPIPDAMP